MTTSLPLGAPGIYLRSPPRVAALTNVRMDVCAFVGVAPRGPARQPVWDSSRTLTGLDTSQPWQRSQAVPVESWNEYEELFGTFEGPGLLPYAVSTFFDQGGTRAYVVRIVPRTSDARAATASGSLGGVMVGPAAPRVWARNPGGWGNGLSLTLRLVTRELFRVDDPKSGTFGARLLAALQTLPGGSLLVYGPDTKPTYLNAEDASKTLGDKTAGRVAVLEGTLDVDDGDGRTEHFVGLGLRSTHPRFVARALVDESGLLMPDYAWAYVDLSPGAAIGTDVLSTGFSGGLDEYASITFDDFFDEATDVTDETPPSGIRAVHLAEDVSMLVVPDLYSPQPLPEPVVNPPAERARFRRCAPAPAPPATPPAPLVNLFLDPRAQLEQIILLQQRVIDLAATARQSTELSGATTYVVLLDVPPRLTDSEIERWRARFDCTFAGCYHPWLRIDRPADQRYSLIDVCPAAVAAGIIARRAIQVGVPFGPANETANSVFDVLDRVSPARHDRLHPLGVNVYLHERDGVRLTAARTLAQSDLTYRQLSVRRLVDMLRRTLLERMQWLAFEPNDTPLRNTVRAAIVHLLRDLYNANAFAGDSEQDSFFVRCDDTNNQPQDVQNGLLRCDVGVAPAEPIEFVVIQLQRDGDGTLRAEA